MSAEQAESDAQYSYFKICPNCEYIWQDRDDFLGDPNVTIMGYMANFWQVKKGILLFMHDVNDCRTTMGKKISSFIDLYHGAVFPEVLLDTEECDDRCRKIYDLQRCDKKCYYAHLRDLIVQIADWPKRTDE